ncbi:MAG: hypothetical protein ACYTEQ_17770 [Planctomycetota bacterium]|jgi:hypothetical protein
MRFSRGICDWLFGKKFVLNLREGKQRKVSKSWVDRMVVEKHIRPMIKVNIVDPMGGFAPEDVEDMDALYDNLEIAEKNWVRAELWTIGKQVPSEKVDEFQDKETGELYAVVAYEEGRPHTYLVRKELWQKTKEQMEQAGQGGL